MIALSFVLLLLAFRTVVIPVQAAVMNLLSIGAAYGVLTAIVPVGWLHGLTGLDGPVPIVSYVPLFMFAVLFGLSMDYEVFLVSQIKEHVDEGQDNTRSVSLRARHERCRDHSRRRIMVFVFGGFVLNGDPTVKQFGVGLAVAVILDATSFAACSSPRGWSCSASTLGTCPAGWAGSCRASASKAKSSSRARDQIPAATQAQHSASEPSPLASAKDS